MDSRTVFTDLMPRMNSTIPSPATYKIGATIIATAHAVKEFERKPESKRRMNENIIQSAVRAKISTIRSTVLLKILNHFGCSLIIGKLTSQYLSQTNCITCAGNQQCPEPDAANPRQVDGVVMAFLFPNLYIFYGKDCH